ncbi:MAG: hypothetical protein ACI9KN_002135 [Gammaproteobacteria bacterium]
MSNWITYEDLVDRIRDLHHEGFSGLITGLSDSKHSFQMGFEDGNIILLTYRVSKGSVALENLVAIKRAKISEHPTNQVPLRQDSIPGTAEILARLTANTASDVTESYYSVTSEATEAELTVQEESSLKVPESRLRVAIERAALHHFGPTAAMICEEHLVGVDITGKNYKSLMTDIAKDVGATIFKIEAFIRSVSNP